MFCGHSSTRERKTVKLKGKIEFDIITTRQSGHRQYTTRHKPKCTYCSYSDIYMVAVAAATTTIALCVLWERDLTWTPRKAPIMHANYNHGSSDANLWMLVLCFMASFVVGSIFDLSGLSRTRFVLEVSAESSHR